VIFIVLDSVARVAGRFFARNYQNKILRRTLDLTRSFYMSANNSDFDMDRNGEIWLLKKISTIGLKIIFDVGANKGDYIQALLKYFSNSQIHAFEILPHNFHYLVNSKFPDNVIRNGFGLSDHEGDIEIWYNSDLICDNMATSYPNLKIAGHEIYYNTSAKCKVKRGLNYLTEKNIKKVDLLKIDVEGHELKVIKGFGVAIQNIRLIQFEFGIFNFVSHDLLSDFFEFLESNDFIIGKLYPKSIFFFKYDFSKESFGVGNYVAINRNDNELISLLSVAV
jgi:FkbM family methyltransferase